MIWADKYRKMRERDPNALVVDEVVQPLLRSLERLWGPSGFNALLGTQFNIPFWFSAHRRQEIERILQARSSIPFSAFVLPSSLCGK